MSLKSRSRRRATIGVRPRTLTRQLIFEPLEERLPLTTFTVTSLDDGPVNLGNATVTLRDAITAANNNVPARRDGPAGTEFDVIQFQAGLTGTITLTEGQLGISSHLTINGPGSQLITISAGDTAGRIFDVRELNPSTVVVAIRGLTITAGERLSPFSGEGGGIFNQENLTIENSIISDNKALDGGGVFNHALGTLTVRNSQINGNQAGSGTAQDDGRGGGLFNAGQATLVDSRVNLNSVGIGVAGGIFNTGALTLQSSLVDQNAATRTVGGISNSGVLNIFNSTIANNRAFSSGGFDGDNGGLHNAPSGTVRVQNSTISGNVADLFAGVRNLGSMMLENSTVSGNIANRDIGGIYNSFSGTLTLRNSTIAANRADFAGGGFGIGAGLHNNNFFGVVMHNTIIVDNVRGSGSGSVVVDNFSGDAANPVSSHNLIGPADSSGLANGGPQGNVVGVANAMLGPLAGNGGPMQTHALLADSPAINAGNNAEVPAELTTDQRGSGFARIANLIVDIGAFEVQSVGPALPGDYNLDGRVNAADYVVWRNTEGDSVTPFSGADGDGNGVVDQADYNVWRTHFGQTMGAGSGSAAVRSSAPVEPVAHSSEPITVTAETQRINGPIAVADSSHGAGKRSAAGRSRDTRPTPAASHHDDALLAWLASRPKATPMVTDYDRESATDAWKDESAGTADDWHVGALDDALASLAEVVR